MSSFDYLRGASLLLDCLVDVPQSPSEVVHLYGVLQSPSEELVVMGHLEQSVYDSHPLCHPHQVLALCISSLRTVWRLTAL